MSPRNQPQQPRLGIHLASPPPRRLDSQPSKVLIVQHPLHLSQGVGHRLSNTLTFFLFKYRKRPSYISCWAPFHDETSFIGGLVAAGFDPTGAYLLAVSYSGRGVFATISWSVWLGFPFGLSRNGRAIGIGPIEGISSA